MALFFLSLSLFMLGGLGALALGRRAEWANQAGMLGALAGGGVGIVSLVDLGKYWLGKAGVVAGFQCGWMVPGGNFSLAIDWVSGVFMIPLFLLGALAAVYGGRYLIAGARGGHGHAGKIGQAWFFFNLLLVSMALVFTARNAILFLMAWEVMALTSFFLVTYEDEKKEVRAAGWTYLVATHIGTAFLLAFFAVLGKRAGSFDFAAFEALGFHPESAGVLFVIVLIGFGAKAGLMPLHVWLPEAHPAAPSHVSALMSGVMIKTGVYGLLRALAWLGVPLQAGAVVPVPLWWGWALIVIGLLSGVLGVLFALSKRDLKKMLAYSSVENVGIITMGLGLYCLGRSVGRNLLAELALAGTLLHVVNHGLFKGLLFLNAGVIVQATGQRGMEGLGGLYKRMPWTGFCFLIGGAAISGIPPFNGFVSEFMIFTAALSGVMTGEGVWSRSPAFASAALVCLAGLGVISGLALACFTKAFGILFLGEPRTAAPMKTRDPHWMMLLPMAVLAGLCLFFGLFSGGIIARVLHQDSFGQDALRMIPPMALGFLLLAGLLALLRARLLRGREVRRAPTWDCGYAAPTPRMQYTAYGFSQMLMDFFSQALRTRMHVPRFAAFFPKPDKFKSLTPDVFRRFVYVPVFHAAAWTAERLRWFQHGNIHLYIFYIAAALLVLLLWKLSGAF